MSKLNRRQFISRVSAAAGSTALLSACGSSDDPFSPKVSFDHGVASGDPLSDRVIIWTRITPQTTASEAPEEYDVVWQIAKDPNFNSVVYEDIAKTSANRDFTVKVDVKGLQPDNHYYYRFNIENTISPVGRTRTLPIGNIESAKLAVVSCSNFGHGYFHVYEELANNDDLRAIIHLGDYIYEYEVSKYSDPALVGDSRRLLPEGELLVLDDYRQRYSLYRRDAALQHAHSQHPFICVWDDHELANDSWIDGAENHQPDEGDWQQRKAFAIQAYREWLPIRDFQNNSDSAVTYRSFAIGNLADLIMLDTRIIGRDKPIDYLKEMIWQQIPFDVSQVPSGGAGVPIIDPTKLTELDPAVIQMITVPFDLTKNPPAPILDWQTITTLDPKNLPAGQSFLPNVAEVKKKLLNAPDRNLLGSAQESWLESTFKTSKEQGKPWQILGQQILTGEVIIPDFRDILAENPSLPASIINGIIMLGQMGLPFNTDAWDGYNQARQRHLKTIKDHATNVVSLAGDTHNAWAFELVPDGEEQPVAVEMATASVSSPGMESYLANSNPDELSDRLIQKNQHLHYQNSHQRGWLEINLTPTDVTGQWFYVDSVKTKSYTKIAGPSYKTSIGTHKLEKV